MSYMGCLKTSFVGQGRKCFCLAQRLLYDNFCPCAWNLDGQRRSGRDFFLVCKMQLGACIWMSVTFRILRSVFHILRYARQYISNLWDSMLILYYFAAPAADLLVCSKGHEHATWGMCLDVRYFPYPKIRFGYLKIRRIWNFESFRFHAHFVLLCSSGMQIVVESSGRELKTSN